jgi:hypothetical protein
VIENHPNLNGYNAAAGEIIVNTFMKVIYGDCMKVYRKGDLNPCGFLQRVLSAPP